MPSPPTPPRAMQLRPRSMAAVVLSRAGATSRSGATNGPAPPSENTSRNRWPTVALWVVLGAAIAAVWALLLLGDSLRSVSG